MCEGAPSAIDSAIRGGMPAVKDSYCIWGWEDNNFGNKTSTSGATRAVIPEGNGTTVFSTGPYQQEGMNGTMVGQFDGEGVTPSWTEQVQLAWSNFFARGQGYGSIEEGERSSRFCLPSWSFPQMNPSRLPESSCTATLQEYWDYMAERLHASRQWLGVALAPHILEADHFGELILRVNALPSHIDVDITHDEEHFLGRKKSIYSRFYQSFCLAPQEYEEQRGNADSAVSIMKQQLRRKFEPRLRQWGAKSDETVLFFDELVKKEGGVINRSVLSEFAKNEKVLEYWIRLIEEDYVLVDEDEIDEMKEKFTKKATEPMYQLKSSNSQPATGIQPLPRYIRITQQHFLKFQKNVNLIQEEFKKLVGQKISDPLQDKVQQALGDLEELGITKKDLHSLVTKNLGTWNIASFGFLAAKTRNVTAEDIILVEKLFNELNAYLYQRLYQYQADF